MAAEHFRSAGWGMVKEGPSDRRTRAGWVVAPEHMRERLTGEAWPRLSVGGRSSQSTATVVTVSMRVAT